MNLPAPLSRFPPADGNGSARAVAVCSDFAGLERFTYQLFCRAADETLWPPRSAGRLAAAAVNPSRLQNRLQDSAPPPVPLAYQLWLSYLLWLEEVLHALDCGPADVSGVELGGLQALARARARFLRTHQVCPRCEGVNPRTGTAPGGTARCRRCLQEY